MTPQGHPSHSPGQQELLIHLSHRTAYTGPVMSNALVQGKNVQLQAQRFDVHVMHKVEFAVKLSM